MNAFEIDLTKIIKSRGVTWILIILSLLASFYSYVNYKPEILVVDTGLWLSSPTNWFSSPLLIFISNIAGSALCCFLMLFINRTFNLLRTVSELYIGIFFLLQASMPVNILLFTGGILLALISLVCIILLYSTYNQPEQTRRIFLIFFLLTAGLLWEYGFILYIILFASSWTQMKILSSKVILAAILGVITPLWICWGFGFISLNEINLPGLPDISLFFSQPDAPEISITTGVTLLIGLITGTMNLMKVISYNTKSRTFFIFFSSIGILTGMLCVIDFVNISFYIPLLNCVTAMQISMFIRLYDKQRAYIIVPILLTIYILCYLWSMAS